MSFLADIYLLLYKNRHVDNCTSYVELIPTNFLRKNRAEICYALSLASSPIIIENDIPLQLNSLSTRTHIRLKYGKSEVH